MTDINVTLYDQAVVWERELQLGQANLLRAIIDFWPPGVGGFLDVGCGDGKLTKAIAAATQADYRGLDPTPTALRSLGDTGVCGSATELPFGTGDFDLVLSTDVLEHLSDDDEPGAWQELFRVARDYVVVAVPFRECLWEARTCCAACGEIYHVNWHQRSYTIASFTDRIPAGWCLVAGVLAGESWTTMPPLETRLRREVLGEWAFWSEAVCPHCGAKEPQGGESRELSPTVALALTRRFDGEPLCARSHSELLIVVAREDKEWSAPSLPKAVLTIRSRQAIDLATESAVSSSLVHLPRVASVIATDQARTLVQLPVLGGESALVLTWVGRLGGRLVLEDALGLVVEHVFSGAESPGQLTIDLPRRLLPGQYGVLVRFVGEGTLTHLGLQNAVHEVAWAQPADGADRPAYHEVPQGSWSLWTQVTGPLWLGCESYETGVPDNWEEALDTKGLLTDIDRASAELTDAQRAQNDRLLIPTQNLEAERDALLGRTREADRLAVSVQNLEAERDALLERVRETDRLAVSVQNLEAERDALLERVRETDRLAISVQNLEAERDALLERTKAAS